VNITIRNEHHSVFHELPTSALRIRETKQIYLSAHTLILRHPALGRRVREREAEMPSAASQAGSALTDGALCGGIGHRGHVTYLWTSPKETDTECHAANPAILLRSATVGGGTACICKKTESGSRWVFLGPEGLIENIILILI